MWGRLLSGLGWVLALGLLVLGLFLAARRKRLAKEMFLSLSALAEGQPARPMRLRAWGPLGRLARAFAFLAPQVAERMARLEQDRRQLRAVLGGMDEGVIAVDSRRRLLFANPSAERLFSLGVDSVGRLLAELVRVPQVQEAVEATLAGHAPHQSEFTLAGRDSLLQDLSRVLAVRGTRLPGTSTDVILVFHDVTDLRRLERMRQDFVTNASHELKTPLAAIKAYTETLLDGALHDDGVNTHFLGQIDEQADRLDRLVRDLLSLARLEAGQEAYRHGPLALAAAVRQCAEAHRGRAEAKGLKFELDLAAVHDATQVRADAEALREVVDNLVDNAIKYTPEGGWVRVSCRPEADGRVTIEVADSGLGIPRDALSRVFERFYRVDQARSRELGGTGLGLAIVKHLVLSLGGSVSVASRLGAGSRFTVTLPTL